MRAGSVSLSTWAGSSVQARVSLPCPEPSVFPEGIRERTCRRETARVFRIGEIWGAVNEIEAGLRLQIKLQKSRGLRAWLSSIPRYLGTATMNLLKLPLAVGAMLAAIQIFYVARTRAMRALAERWRFHYIGPPPKLWRPISHPIARPPVPTWVSHLDLFGPITRISNVIEGTVNGVTVLIFDVIVGESRGSHPCTLIACQAEENPFGRTAWSDRVIQTPGWTVVHGVWLLWFSWTMRVTRIDQHLRDLYPGSQTNVPTRHQASPTEAAPSKE